MDTPGIIVFDPVAFVEAFPAFATVPESALNNNFALAELMLDNSFCSIVCDVNTRAQLLNLATAHITALLNGINGAPPQGVVGRVSNATEGSVSVATQMVANSESASFWQQTQWGALFWQTTLRFRTARYLGPCDANDDCNSWQPSWPQ